MIGRFVIGWIFLETNPEVIPTREILLVFSIYFTVIYIDYAYLSQRPVTDSIQTKARPADSSHQTLC